MEGAGVTPNGAGFTPKEDDHGGGAGVTPNGAGFTPKEDDRGGGAGVTPLPPTGRFMKKPRCMKPMLRRESE